jgi:2-dehydropantoate 2-reductase
VKERAKNILVVGPGALGTYFAARLGHKYPGVWVLDRRADRAAQLQERGFHVTGVGALDWIAPDGRVSASVKGWPDMDVIFILTKATGVAAAARDCRPAAARGALVVLLQNGWGGEEGAWKVFGKANVVLGVTEEGVTLASAGHAFHAASGETVLDGRCRGAAEVARLLAAAGFAARVSKAFEKERWSKLLVNACLNPLGALADVPNGRVAQPPLDGLLDRLADECAKISAAGGRAASPADTRRRVRDVAQRTAANRNSLWQDLARGRPTEREYLLGPFLEIARRRKLDAPLLSFLDRLLRKAEAASADA